MHEPDKLPDSESKTQRKKQMLALQDIGKMLVELPAAQLAKIPLESPLAEAVAEARKLKSHEGKRRQMQYIGKLMRNVDAEPIIAALNKVQMKGQLNKAKFHQVEQWRDRLITKGDPVLQEFIQKFPHTDVQHLRQLMRKAQQEAEKNKDSGGNTILFRYLHQIIDES